MQALKTPSRWFHVPLWSWGILLGLVFLGSACKNEQTSPTLQELQLLFEEDFKTFDSSRWVISQQSLDAAANPSSTLSLSNVTAKFTTHIRQNNQSCFTQAYVNLIDDFLRLSAGVQSFNCPDSANLKAFGGSEIRLSSGPFNFGRFYIEFRSQPSPAMITSFFLASDSSEIGFHFPGNNPTTVWLSHQRGDQKKMTVYALPFNASEGFHGYGFLWDRGVIAWEIDGTEVYGTRSNVPEDSLQLYLTTWVSGDSSQASIPNGFSGAGDLDLVRVDQFSGSR